MGGEGGEGGIKVADTPAFASKLLMYAPVHDKLPGKQSMSSCATASTPNVNSELLVCWPHAFASAVTRG
jgi:hypothetical protein